MRFSISPRLPNSSVSPLQMCWIESNTATFPVVDSVTNGGSPRLQWWHGSEGTTPSLIIQPGSERPSPGSAHLDEQLAEVAAVEHELQRFGEAFDAVEDGLGKHE